MKNFFTLLFALILFAGSSWGQSVIIGTGTTTTDGSILDPVERYYNYEHYQIIYTAAELSAAGMPSGASITALGFSISESAVSLANYTISMGLTTQTIAQPYITALTTVKPAFTYTPVVQAAGSFDMIPFTTNFTWDGTSNIVINTCTGSNPFTTPYGGLRYTDATSGTITYVRTDGSSNCANTSLTSTTYRPNIQFNYTGGSPCSGTPAPGNTISSANPVCPSVSFTLSLQNPTPGSGVTYQWQSSPNGSAWSPVGTSSSVFTTSQTTATYYRCQVTCSGNTGISTALQVTMNPFFNCYCSSGAQYTSDEDITNVTFGTSLNNTSACASLIGSQGTATGTADLYSNFTSIAATNVYLGASVPISVTITECAGNAYSHDVRVYIDFNQNGLLTDAGEEFIIWPYANSNTHTINANIAIPSSATLGNTLMRVVCKESSTTGPCLVSSWGETEDYRVNISTPTSPNLSTIPGSLTFGYVPFGSSSSQQSYVLSGTYLTAGPIVVTAPSGYGVSLTNGGPYTSSVSVSYTPPTLANTNIYVRFTPPAPNTTYNGNITNVGGSATRNVTVTGSSDLYSIYCTSTATYTADEDIFNVTLGGINNSSTCSTLAPGPGSVQNMYSNYFYAVAPANLPASTIQNFSVQIGTCGTYNYNNAIKIFIDFNQNGNFSDAGEQIYVSPSSTSGAHTETGSFTVPADANLGNAMMRVVCVETSTPSGILACGTYGWGETEDYQVSISTTATVTTNAATAISSTGATLNATVSANNSSTTVKFEYGTMSAPPFDHSVTLPTQVTGQNSAVNTIITGLQPNTTYYFRAVGTNSNGTTNGSILSFPTTTVAPAVTTNGPTLVGSSFATMNGTATAFNANTTVSFEYGLTPGGPYPIPVAGVPALVTGNTPTDFSATITGLVINTNYYYRAKGVNIAGTTYGIEKTFYTTCVVPPILGAISGPVNVCKTGTGYIFSVVPVPYAFVYYWTFPAGFTITSFPNSNSVTVSVSNSAVSGSITVHAASDCGAIGPNSPAFTVTVRDLPVVSITGAAPACQYANNNYTTQAGMTSYLWSVSPDGTITPTSNPNVVSINWALTGAKTVGVIYTNSFGCTAAAPGTLPVTVNAAPVPTVSGINNLCLNSGFYDYTTESGMTGYVWTVSPGGTITAGQGSAVAQVVWNTPGAQYVTVNYNNLSNCSALTATVYNVTVNGLPGNSGAITGSSNVCTGSNGVAYSVPPITNAITYIWSLPAGATIASGDLTNSITVNFAPTAVSGDITVYGNSLCGNGPVSAPFHVTVTYSPVAAGSITGVGSVCEGEKDVPYSVSPVTNATGYVWTLPAGATLTSGANTPNITVNFAMGATSGNIFVFGTNFCGHGDISPAFPVVIKPVPKTPFIYAQGDTLFSDIPDGNQWFYQGVAILTATGQSFVARYPGWYWDQVTLDGCASDTSNHIYIGVIGINEPSASSFVVYPVPNDGLFKLSMNSLTAEPFNIIIYNNIGITVYTKENITAKGPTDLVIDLRPISSGVYTMVIRNANNKVVRKIIINR